MHTERSVTYSWKDPAQAAQMLKPLNALVKGEIFDGKRLTVEGIMSQLLTSDLFAFDPAGEAYEVMLRLCDVKVLNEHDEVPEEDWPLHLTKPTFGPISIHCRPERTSMLGALIKICLVEDLLHTDDDFKVVREKIKSLNASLGSLADRYAEMEQERRNPASHGGAQLALAV